MKVLGYLMFHICAIQITFRKMYKIPELSLNESVL